MYHLVAASACIGSVIDCSTHTDTQAYRRHTHALTQNTHTQSTHSSCSAYAALFVFNLCSLFFPRDPVKYAKTSERQTNKPIRPCTTSRYHAQAGSWQRASSKCLISIYNQIDIDETAAICWRALSLSYALPLSRLSLSHPPPFTVALPDTHTNTEYRT